MRHEDSKLAGLRGVALFDRCSDKDLRRIAGLCDLTTIPAGRALITEGEQAAEVFVVVSGDAVVSRAGHEVARVGAGEALGEMSFLDRPEPRSATVVADTEMQLLVFEPRAFSSLLESFPTVGRSIASTLADRLRVGTAPSA